MRKIASLTVLVTVTSLPVIASIFEVPAENVRISSHIAQNATLLFEGGTFTAQINGNYTSHRYT